ncbi:MAG: vanadium-dependent haloperoxidase [Pseudoxanthomonas sp.]
MKRSSGLHVSLLLLLATAAPPQARADVVTDWNRTATQIAAAAKLPPPPANRAIAMVQTAVYAATNAITRQYPASELTLQAPAGASVDAAVAAANHKLLLELVPAQQAATQAAYDAALAKVADGQAKRDGIAVGEQAAAAVLAARANDVVVAVESYRPITQAGVYVPTAVPAVPQWPQRVPWLMRDAAQFRPGPPPALSSAIWARDYNESQAFGGKAGSRRTPAHTDMARFWEATLPVIYYGVVQSVADRPGRTVTRNARLLMAVAQSMDDALIAVFDAKYHYHFWRPITAIRNGDQDGNDATVRDASWLPFIDTPMHPEYPCAHCIVASALGTVLKAEVGNATVPVLATTSYTANDSRREWKSIDAFVLEVSEARIYDGVHFRNSTEVGRAMGRQVGGLAAAKYLQSGP